MNPGENPPTVACKDFALIVLRSDGSRIRLPFAKPANFLSAAGTTGEERSQPHVVILNCDNQLYIRDLTGRAHLRVNGSENTGSVIFHGDRVQLGKADYEVYAPEVTALKKSLNELEALLIGASGESWSVRKPIMVIGTDKDADLQLQEGTGALAMIMQLSGRFWVTSLQPTLVLQVNGQPVSRSELTDGAEIAIGTSTFRFQITRSPVSHKIDKIIETSAESAEADSQIWASDKQTQSIVSKKNIIEQMIQDGPKDASRLKRWGPLAFAVVSANRPNLVADSINSANGTATISRRRKYLLLWIAFLAVLIGLGSGGYYAWHHFKW